MPPKKAAAGNADQPSTPGGSRRSTRIAATPATVKKRYVDEDDDDEFSDEPAPKKAKRTPKSAVQTKSEDPAKDAGSDTKELALGDVLPSLVLKNDKGEDVEVHQLAATKGLVLFTVPKADTPGCTTQACGFRDNLPEFENLDYAVFCLSADSPAAQAKWAAKKQFGFSLLSDPERTLIRALGTLKSPTSTKRSHFVFEKGTAKLIEKKLGVKPADSPTDVLKFLKSHHA